MTPTSANDKLPLLKKMTKKEREVFIKDIKDIAQELSELYQESIYTRDRLSVIGKYSIPELRAALPALNKDYIKLKDSELREHAQTLTTILKGYQEDLRAVYLAAHIKLGKETLNSLRAFKVYAGNCNTLTLEDTFSVSRHQEDIISQIRAMSALQSEIDFLDPQVNTADFKITEGLILNEEYFVTEKIYKSSLASSQGALLQQRLIADALGFKAEDFSSANPMRALNLNIVEKLLGPEVIVALDREPNYGKLFNYAQIASPHSKTCFLRMPAAALAHRAWVTEEKDFVSIDGLSAAEIEIMLTLYGDDEYPTLHSALVAAKILA